MQGKLSSRSFVVNLLPEIASRYSTKEKRSFKFFFCPKAIKKLQKEKLEMQGMRYANVISRNETDVPLYDE